LKRHTTPNAWLGLIEKNNNVQSIVIFGTIKKFMLKCDHHIKTLDFPREVSMFKLGKLSKALQGQPTYIIVQGRIQKV
jgi:hypothetical protein